MAFELEGYEIEEQLHDGPGSHVYRGRRGADEQAVVLKVLKPILPDPDRLARFRREHETLRSLDGRGVALALGLEQSPHGWILVQRDTGGSSLNRILGRHALSLQERLRLALRIVDALGVLHEQRVIHKDINPANIVWNRDDDALVIIDFGIAVRLSRQHATLRHPELLEGTLAYIAPEQTGRMNRDIDYRADYYSLGSTLYQLFTGRLPFTTDDPLELVHSHIARTPVAPHVVDPELPPMLSGIIMKLMAKMAESRYQSSYGVRADLRECLARLDGSSVATAIELGREDVSEWFQIPQKLYGRDAEIETLVAAFEHVVRGAGQPELVLVKGYSGIGKSALVKELYRPITAGRGYFAAGKFDQLQRGTPYSALVSALRSLVRQLLGEPKARLVQWREQLLAALGPNAGLITDLVPELEVIIGAQPSVPEIGAMETQNRFGLAFHSFVQVLAAEQHPLVLFLDDLQWADSGSLSLIERMMTNDRTGHLLVIGAYRDNEVDSAHPLTMTIDAVARSGAITHQIPVPPLAIEHVTELVADALGSDSATVAPLAELVLSKTAGNPLFVTQILKEVHQDGLITLDRESGRWCWDIERIKARGITDNVVDLMVGKLRRQAEATQDVLRFAACLGNEFGLEALATIREQPLSETFAALLPAIGEELVVPASQAEIALPEVAGAPLAARTYRFLHDRVQQAAYSLMDAAERTSIHLRAGRLLLRSVSEQEREDRVFELVDQLNHGRHLMADPAERAELARLDALAGHRAKVAAAYTAAKSYLELAHALLPTDAWEVDYEFTGRVYRDLAEAESLVSNYSRAEALARELLEHVHTPVEKAEAYNLILNQKTMLAEYGAAIVAARDGLALLGVTHPEDADLERAVMAEGQAILELLGERSIASLLDEPLVEDPGARTAMKLLVNTIPASFYAYTNRLGYAFGVLKTVRISLEHGLSPQSADLYSYYGHLLATQRGQYRTGYDFGELSIKLAEKLNAPGDRCRSCFILADFMLVWVRHIREARPINDAGYQAGLEAGEFLFAGYILFYKLQHMFYDGSPLARVLAELPDYLQFAQQAKNQLAIDFIVGLRRAIGALREGQPAEQSDAEYLATCAGNQSMMAICYHHILRTQAHYLFGEYAAGLASAQAAEQLIAAIAGNIAVAEHNFYMSLCLVALLRECPAEERDGYTARLRANEEAMAGWARTCPQNFEHMLMLIRAELAAVEGRHHEAMDLYERAIAAAHEHSFVHDEALAKELAGRAWLGRGNRRVGLAYLAEARHDYRHWGATRKAAALELELPELVERRATRSGGVATTTTDQQDSRVLDLGSVLKASHAISTEIVLERLLTTLMKVVIENAGAERAVLLLEKDGELMARVSGRVVHAGGHDDVVVEMLEPIPASQYEGVAESIVVYVQRTQQVVLLGDASHEGQFAASPSVAGQGLRSVLALPLVAQGHLLGALYLENNLTVGAFTPERTEVLELLSSQIGISLENALLYSEMEQRVAERTAELSRKNADLEEALTNLEAAQNQLIHAEKMASLGRLTTGIAHEMRNPLNFINNFAKLNVELVGSLMEALEKDPHTPLESVRDDLDDLGRGAARVFEHGKRVDAIVNSMMAHATTTPSEHRPVQLRALLDQCIDIACRELDVQRPGHAVRVERRYEGLSGEVDANPHELGRVISSLLSNAFYAVLEPPVSSPPTVIVAAEVVGGRVELRIADSGPGVPAAIQQKIFEPFFTTKPAGSGTGLGLPLSYDIVRAHHGTLTLASAEGPGATFVVTLPMR